MRDDPALVAIDERLHRGGATRQVGTPVLHVDGLSKAFGKKCAVEDVSFTLRDRELVAVLGPSGAGKTTLFRCVTGIIRPDSGRVWFDGADIAAVTSTGRRRIAIVFQDFNLVRRLTAFENVLGGRLPHVAPWRGILRQFERSDKRKAFECLERVGFLDQAHQRADSLSGGQQQRVAVARALAQEARPIVADEPIASLGPRVGGGNYEPFDGYRSRRRRYRNLQLTSGWVCPQLRRSHNRAVTWLRAHGQAGNGVLRWGH